jgi:hypothetical protein
VIAGTAPIFIGWQYAPAIPDPGPPPARTTAAQPARLDPGWVQAKREIYRRLDRPARLGGAACAFAAGSLAAAWVTGLVSAALAGGAIVAALACGAGLAGSVVRSKRTLGAVIAAERSRIAATSAVESARLAHVHKEHATDYRAWRRRRAIFERQPSWFAVSLPAGIDRLDVAGGTLAGWSALLTTIGATHLSLGGEVTIVDLTEGAVAADLINLASQSGLRPLVWVLPADLPRLDLGEALDVPTLADVLALAVGAGAERTRSGESGGADHATDCALIERVLCALGPGASIVQLTSALRVLADIGPPRADLRTGLITTEQFDRIGTMFGRGAADRVVIERAWAIESKLRRLEALGTDQAVLPPSVLRVAALDRRSGVIGNAVLRAYLVAALTQMLRQAPSGRPWQHTLCLFGAERLGGDVVDRLSDACEVSRTGLVLGYRSVTPNARERLGRGNAAIAFMRLGNGDDARVASELIGTEHRFVVGQLTDTVGTSLTDTLGDSYTSTVGTADSVADSVSTSLSRGQSAGRGRSYQGGFAPFGDFSNSRSGEFNHSIGTQRSVSLTEGINTGTSWGLSLSRALGENASLGRTAQRSREFLVEASELQRLPPSGAIISYPAPAGRTVLFVDTNPAIVALPGTATLRSAHPQAEAAGDG